MPTSLRRHTSIPANRYTGTTMPLRDLTGQRFERLAILEYAGSRRGGGAIWRCQCDCGAIVECHSANLVNGRTKSCGCFAKDNPTNLRHGRSRTTVHNVWGGMRQRCENPSSEFFPDYGGRGITVCDRWQVFENFLADMGEPPPGMTIDRIDNDGPYSPENCRWATKIMQARNKRSVAVIEWRGKALTLPEWEQATGIPRQTLWHRMKKKGLHGDALFKPLRVTARGPDRARSRAGAAT